jgi:DNA-binding NarL/FixJ family response regulator
MIRIVLAEDHHLVRQAIHALLERASDMQIVGEAADGEEAVRVVQQLRPDVLLLDIAMPRLDGIQTARRVRNLKLPTQVIMLSMHQDEATVRQALESGALGYVLKGSLYEELLLAVRAVVRGEAYLAPAVTAIVLQEFLRRRSAAEQAAAVPRVTPREREVLQAIAEGRTNGEIAQLLGISVRTVERHRANILTKFGAHDVVSLLRVARRSGLIFTGAEEHDRAGDGTDAA